MLQKRRAVVKPTSLRRMAGGRRPGLGGERVPGEFGERETTAALLNIPQLEKK